MKLTFRVSRRILGGAALIASAALLPGTALAATASPAATTARTTAAAQPSWFAPRCLITQTRVSLGPGDAAAGTVFYALRFTNISRRTCGMIGYPKTYAEYQDGKVIGNASRKIRGPQRWFAVTPGATVHSVLGIAEAGNICSKPVWAAGMRVFAPGQFASSWLNFKFQACHGHVTVMSVTPVVWGKG
jgi:Protein of unknown function (DUF4232)